MSPDFETLPSPLRAGLRCTCPRCAGAPLFKGFLSVNARCENCGLDLKFADSADGPAIFIIFLVSPMVMVLAFVTEALFHPAPFVHLLLWIPVTILLCLALLRSFKAFLIALQYRGLHPEHRS